jgi:hypothetical protein
MTLRRWSARTDTNALEIKLALENVGCTVQRLSEPGVPDFLVARNGRVWLLEVKGAKGKLTPAQVAWHKWWRAPVHVVRTVEGALNLVLGA